MLVCLLDRIMLNKEKPSGNPWPKECLAVLNQSRVLFSPGSDVGKLSAK